MDEITFTEQREAREFHVGSPKQIRPYSMQTVRPIGRIQVASLKRNKNSKLLNIYLRKKPLYFFKK